MYSNFEQSVLCTVALTTVSWLVTAYVSKPISRERLVEFYRKVRLSGPGWAAIRREAGLGAVSVASGLVLLRVVRRLWVPTTAGSVSSNRP